MVTSVPTVLCAPEALVYLAAATDFPFEPQALTALEELANLHQASLIVKGRKVAPDEVLGTLKGTS